MNRLACTIALAAVVAAVVPASLPAQDTDPINGTWKLNLAKSKFNRGPAPQSETRRYEVSGDDFKLTTDGISAEGKPIHFEIKAKIDGKAYPTPGLGSGLDSIAMTRVDAYTTKSVQKRAGKPAVYVTRKVGKDGKSMTLEFQGTDDKGRSLTTFSSTISSRESFDGRCTERTTVAVRGTDPLGESV